MISKLLLVRCTNPNASGNSTLLSRAGVTQYAKGEPIEARPHKWHEEDGPSHYAHVLTDIPVKELRALQDFVTREEHAGVSLHDVDLADIKGALARVGLVHHEA